MLKSIVAGGSWLLCAVRCMLMPECIAAGMRYLLCALHCVLLPKSKQQAGAVCCVPCAAC
jgi:hypothetical protein